MKDSIKKYQFKEGLGLEFEILDLSQVLEMKKGMMTIPHRAQFYHIMWIEKGKGAHHVDFKPIELENNTVIFVPQNSVGVFDEEGIYKGKTITGPVTVYAELTTDYGTKNQKTEQVAVQLENKSTKGNMQIAMLEFVE